MTHLGFDAGRYPAALASLIPSDDRLPLGVGAPCAEVVEALGGLDVETAFAPRRIVDQQMARACLGALWLAHNFLDESHEISQDLPNATGSYWHGVMHRREGDFANAKYWFRQAGNHPVLVELGGDVAEIVGPIPPEKSSLTDSAGRLDPCALVDWCSASARGDHAQDEALEKLTRREWERLFDWCYRRAVGED